MKLIEKLAETSTEENDPCSPDYYQGFLAGFRKAIDMAACLGKTLEVDDGYHPRQQIASKIRSLGEEEIK